MRDVITITSITHVYVVYHIYCYSRRRLRIYPLYKYMYIRRMTIKGKNKKKKKRTHVFLTSVRGTCILYVVVVVVQTHCIIYRAVHRVYRRLAVAENRSVARRDHNTSRHRCCIEQLTRYTSVRSYDYPLPSLSRAKPNGPRWLCHVRTWAEDDGDDNGEPTRR